MSTPRVLVFALLLAACGQAPVASDPQVEAAPSAPARAPEVAASLEFRDPDPGPRAPVTRVFAAELGLATFPEIEALTTRLGLKCSDTSIRAMMESKRAAERKKMAERGEDAVSSASWMKKKSKREANPQIRFSCPKVQAEEIQDRPRKPSAGRLLFVFDSADHPLRHVSYQRSHVDHEAAFADLEDSIAAMKALFGEPTGTRGELPQREGGAIRFEANRQYEVRWEYSDLLVKVTAIQFGPNKVTIGERVEVPHGIRPDAPRLNRAPARSPDAPIPEPTPKDTAPVEGVPAVPTVVDTPASEATPADRGPLG